MRQESGPEKQPAEETIRDIRRTLEKLGIPRSSFYRWYDSDRSLIADYGVAAVFSFDNARILTRTLAGLAAAFTISPLKDFGRACQLLRAGAFRRLTFSSPGNANSPTPRGCTELRNRR